MNIARMTIATALLTLLIVPISATADVSEAELQRIEAAAPDEPVAEPIRPRRLLVFTRCRGYRHSAVEYASAALTILGDKTGAWETTVSDDPNQFDPNNLARYDAVVMNNTTGRDLLTPEGMGRAQAEAIRDRRRQALLDFVASGKGLVGIHAATDSFYDAWPAYGELMGGYFHGHPWNERVGVRVDDPNSPLTAMFDPNGFDVVDEIYQFRQPYSRDRLRVLLSLDVERTDMTKRGINRDDGDFAVSWVQRHGRGRVFYCSMGHRHELYWAPAILAHYLAGIQFALGDLDALAVPSNAEWQDLTEDLSAWRGAADRWRLEDGVLACQPGAGYLWTRETYGDFELSLEFKISPNGNSGVFVRTSDLSDPVQSGIEIQVLDSHGREAPGRHDCGAIYDCLAPSVNAAREAGQWNRMHITCRDNWIEVVLNDQPIIGMDLSEWTEAHRNPDGSENKFNRPLSEFSRTGHIGLQDHGNPVWYRNIRVRPLE